ncbi:MAG: hypothetical protein HFI93_06905 [Lachnospiraceae bacterium]|nr:hypothetical protein [Lachnospiraceae bacterium]
MKIFWIGLGFFLILLVVAVFGITASKERQNAAFPVEISMAVLSIVYIGLMTGFNLLFDFLIRTDLLLFGRIHMLAFLVYAALTGGLFVFRSRVFQRERFRDGRAYEKQILICEFEAVRDCLAGWRTEAKKEVLPLMDSLLDDLRFSEPAGSADVSDMDDRLRGIARMLLAEAENLAEIRSENLSGIEDGIRRAKKVIRDRDRQIRLISHLI